MSAQSNFNSSPNLNPAVVRPINMKLESAAIRSGFKKFALDRMVAWENDLEKWTKEASLYKKLMELAGKTEKSINGEVSTYFQLSQLMDTAIPNLRQALKLLKKENAELEIDELRDIQLQYDKVKSQFGVLKFTVLGLLVDTYPVRLF